MYRFDTYVQRRVWQWRREAEITERKKKSACRNFNRLLQLDSRHVYGNYKSYNYNKMLYDLSYISLPEDKVSYGSIVLLRSIYVLPKYRGNDLAERFVRACNDYACKTQCILVAVCSPFEIECDKAFDNDFEHLSYLAKDVSQRWSTCFHERQSWEKPEEERRTRMKTRLLNNNWEPFNIEETLGNKERNKCWSFAYIPTTVNEELLQAIERRRAKRERKC